VHALSAERPETAAEWDATAIFVFALIACFARPAQMLSVHARRSNYGRGWQKPSLSEVLLAYLRARAPAMEADGRGQPRRRRSVVAVDRNVRQDQHGVASFMASP
jgi:hypothetical protein